MRVVNQPLAIDDNTPRLFEAATGVFLRYQEYTDPAAYLRRAAARLRADRDIGADVVVVPDLQTAQMIEAGFVRPLPSPPPRTLIVPAFANPRFDPGRRFSLPWSSTVVGLAFDRRRVHEPGHERSCAVRRALRREGGALGRRRGHARPRDAGVGRRSRDRDADSGRRGGGTRSHRLAGGQIRSLATTEYIDDLVSGRALLAIARSDEIRIARQTSPTLGFVVPSEGGLLESTNMVVPTGALDVDDAGVFIDYMFAPDPNSRLASFGSRITTVGAVPALQSIDPKAGSIRSSCPILQSGHGSRSGAALQRPNHVAPAAREG